MYSLLTMFSFLQSPNSESVSSNVIFEIFAVSTILANGIISEISRPKTGHDPQLVPDLMANKNDVAWPVSTCLRSDLSKDLGQQMFDISFANGCAFTKTEFLTRVYPVAFVEQLDLGDVEVGIWCTRCSSKVPHFDICDAGLGNAVPLLRVLSGRVLPAVFEVKGNQHSFLKRREFPFRNTSLVK